MNQMGNKCLTENQLFGPGAYSLDEFDLAYKIYWETAHMVGEWYGVDPDVNPSKSKPTSFERNYEVYDKDSTCRMLVKTILDNFIHCEKFKFECTHCNMENIAVSALRRKEKDIYEPVLEKCANNKCSASPYKYVTVIRNQLMLVMKSYIKRFHQNLVICRDCNIKTRLYDGSSNDGEQVCIRCKESTLEPLYAYGDLRAQLDYFQYMFDLSNPQYKNVNFSPVVRAAYNVLRETVDQQLKEKSIFRDFFEEEEDVW